MSDEIAIIDLFAGPGGLGEGFSAAGCDGGRPMNIHLSVEMDRFAHQTLRLRSFLRSFGGRFPQEYYDSLNRGEVFADGRPDWAEAYPSNWEKAEQEALRRTLGTDGVFEELAPKLDAARDGLSGNTILIGGPPCQAYSLAGRVRNKGKADYVPEDDGRHYLYREYVRILERLEPAAFVMENVKGLLSSKVDGGKVFHRILEDLSQAGSGYELLALRNEHDGNRSDLFDRPEPEDFVVRAENYGVPQERHRVIIVGLRRDLCSSERLKSRFLQLNKSEPSTVEQALFGLPPIRSGRNDERKARVRIGDSPEAWLTAVFEAIDAIAGNRDVPESLRRIVSRYSKSELAAHKFREGTIPVNFGKVPDTDLSRWLWDPRLTRVQQHQTRAHIPGDLARYLYAATYAREFGMSPKLKDFPEALHPEHRNKDSGHFADRFRVQLADKPSKTITSHISKDGHYYIHPDPLQCRSLTVREAARLQTFPDNYYFCGPRTEQYKQVGNAVPPILARQIAVAVRSMIS